MHLLMKLNGFLLACLLFVSHRAVGQVYPRVVTFALPKPVQFSHFNEQTNVDLVGFASLGYGWFWLVVVLPVTFAFNIIEFITVAPREPHPTRLSR